MAAPTVRDVIQIDVKADVKQGIAEIEKLTDSMSENMKKNQRAAEKMGKGISQVFKQFSNAKTKAAELKTLTAQLKEVEDGIEGLAKAKTLHDKMVLKARSHKAGSTERKEAMARAKDLKTMYGGLGKKKYASSMKALTESKKSVEGSKESMEDIPDGDWEEAGEVLSTAFTDLLSRDAPTIAKRIGKLMTIPIVTDKMKGWGDKLGDRGKERMKGAKWGGGGAGGGSGSKALGGLERTLGGVMKLIAGIGPFIQMASGFFAGFVKILLDAEAAGKQFNKSLLETTSTAGFLSRNFGDAKKASADLQNSLAAARDGAHDFSNVQWGITGEIARSFQSAITAEGVALDDLGKATVTATVSAEQHAKTVQMGVAFSRQFGVSLSEIAQTQGQLMADVGLAGEGVTASFQMIADGAASAGMEANKFFGVIRSFSSDLNLFSLRMEDLTKIMGTLGKTMDPRKMGQFVQSLSQKFSGGITENLKIQMMAGGSGRKIMEKDLGAKFESLSRDLKNSLGDGSEADISDLMKLIKKNDPRAVAAWTEKRKDKVKGPVAEAITKLRIQNQRMSSGDRLDAASIMDELSPLSKVEMLQAATKTMFGKKLEDLTGIELAAAESAGIASAKEIQMYTQLHQGILQGQEGLLARMEGNALTPEDVEQLNRMNVESGKRTGKDAADALRKAFQEQGGDRKYYDSLDKSQQDLVQAAVKTKDFQQEASEHQVSMLEKLDMITAILMNKIFTVIEWVGKLVKGIFGGGRDVKQEAKDSAAVVAGSKDKGLQQAFGAGKSIWDKRTKAIDGTAARAMQGIKNAVGRSAELQSQIAAEKDPGKKAGLEKELAALKPALDLAKKYGQDTSGLKKELYKISDSEALGGVTEAMKVLSQILDAGITVVPGPKGPQARDDDHSLIGGSPQKAAAAAAAAAAKAQTTSAPAGAAAAGPVASQAPAKAAAAAEEQVKQQEKTVSAVEGLERAAANDGIKLHPATVSGPLKDTMADSVYEGAAKALFEYYMYSGLDRAEVVNQMKSEGLDGAGFRSKINAGVSQGMAPGAALVAPARAMGGTVTSIMNGLATVTRPARGEGFTSIGVGETIVPAGGGGGGGGTTKVELVLKGDLSRFIDARVTEGAARHDRNKRLR